MKGEILFEKMAGISDEYVAEAALAEAKETIPTVDITPAPKKRFPVYLIGGLAAACICFMLTVSALVGAVVWGQMDGLLGSTSTPTFPLSPNAPLWQRFDFSFSMTDGEGQPLQSFASPGDTVLVDTTLTNRGLPFFYTGSSSEFCAYAEFVLQGNESVTIPGGIFHTTDVGTFPVLMGEVGHGQYFFTIPENATPGVYDLVLSYKDTKQVFSGVLTVGDPAESPFDFGYLNVMSGPALRGTELFLEVWVTNNGEGFTSNRVFRPQATLYYTDEATPYAIEGVLVNGQISALPSDTAYVESGEIGRGAYAFSIPEDAPTGTYSLVLSFGEASESFERILTVADGTQTGLFDIAFEYALAGDAVAGTAYYIDTCVINEGGPFTIVGSSMSFAPTAVLIHRETQYRIEGHFGMDDDYVTVTVNTGDKGQVTQEFFIPADAPTGDYDLVLSYGGCSTTFEGVLTIAKPTVEVPGILSNLTMPIGKNWLYDPIDEAYVPGQEVTVRIRFATDVGTLFFLNGEIITTEVGDDQLGYWEYTFDMPNKDSEIIFQTYDGTAPYSDILEAYYIANPKAEGVRVSDYGTYGDGVRVAIIDDARYAYTQMEEEHRIGPAVIRYADGNYMQVLHNGSFCSLVYAYGSGLLSDADMAALENLQREWNPHLYADDE